MTPADAEIRNCFIIQAPSDISCGSPKRFRDPFGLSIAAKIVAGLRALNYQATDPKLGKACDACFKIIFSGFCVNVILLVKRSAAEVQSLVITDPRKSLFSRVSTEEMRNSLAGVGASMDEILRNQPGITSVSWLTHSQAEKYFAKTDRKSVV